MSNDTLGPKTTVNQRWQPTFARFTATCLESRFSVYACGQGCIPILWDGVISVCVCGLLVYMWDSVMSVCGLLSCVYVSDLMEGYDWCRSVCLFWVESKRGVTLEWVAGRSKRTDYSRSSNGVSGRRGWAKRFGTTIRDNSRSVRLEPITRSDY